MKYLILVALMLCLPVRVEAWQVVGGGEENVCIGGTTDYVGYTGSAASSSYLTEGRIYIQLHTPTCTTGGCTAGTMSSAALYSRYEGTESAARQAKVCVYLDDGDGVPDSSDSLVSCTGAIAAGTGAGYRTGAISGAITCSSAYFVAVISADATNAWRRAYAGSPTTDTYYQDIAGSFASPPETLAGTWVSGTGKSLVHVSVE